MQAILERALSGQRASCSPHCLSGCINLFQVPTLVAPIGCRGSRAVAAASKPTKASAPQNGKRPSSSAPGKGAKTKTQSGTAAQRKATPQSKPQAKPQAKPQGAGATARQKQAHAKSPKGGASPRLPHPPSSPPAASSAAVSIAAASQASSALATQGASRLPRPRNVDVGAAAAPALADAAAADSLFSRDASAGDGRPGPAAASLAVPAVPAGQGMAAPGLDAAYQPQQPGVRHLADKHGEGIVDGGGEGEDDEGGDEAEADGFMAFDSGTDSEHDDEQQQGMDDCGCEEDAEGGLNEGLEDDEEEAFPVIQLNLPQPSKVKIKTAVFMKSSVSVSECPPPRLPEFAVIGRSNVGKSSLINMLTGRKDLAMVSKQPGKTRCINHFLINDSWYLVDLPGYGYAKVGLKGRQQFDAFTREYFKERPNLAMVFLLVDASIPPQAIDVAYANWLTDNEVPFTLVFTKADKRRKGLTTATRDSHVTAFKRALLEDLAYLPPSMMTSAAKGLGRGELTTFIASLRTAYEKSGRLKAIQQGMV